jgi:hypothetical protein
MVITTNFGFGVDYARGMFYHPHVHCIQQERPQLVKGWMKFNLKMFVAFIRKKIIKGKKADFY